MKRRYLVLLIAGMVAAVTPSATAQSVQVIDSADGSVVFTGWWLTIAEAGAIGGSERRGEFGGATVELAFSGSAVALIHSVGPDRGRATVRIDGAVVGILDQYAAVPAAQQRAAWTVAPGQHRLVLTVDRTKQAPSTGYTIAVDAFEVAPTEPTSTPTSMPTMTATTVPSTPAPTDTPTSPPTATSLPTSTAAPTDTPAPSPSATLAPDSGVTCVGINLELARTVTCERANPATPWPTSWPVPID